MYKNKGFPGVFTVSLRGEIVESPQLRPSEEIRALILLQKNEDTPDNHTFLERFLAAIPFITDHSEVKLMFTDSCPSWTTIREAYPNCKFIMLLGFSYENIGLQFRQAVGQLLPFRSFHFMELPKLEEWKDNKELKLHIWQQLKTIETL